MKWMGCERVSRAAARWQFDSRSVVGHGTAPWVLASPVTIERYVIKYLNEYTGCSEQSGAQVKSSICRSRE